MSKAKFVPKHTLTADELATLIRLAKKAVWADLDTRRALQDQRVNVIPSDFYSEVPGVRDFEASFEFAIEGGPYNSPEVFHRGRLRRFLGVLDAYADEFDPPADGDEADPAGFFWGNPAFSAVDAMAYYCMLRHVKPERVIEIGSGFSTLVALAALERNGKGRVCCIEPFPLPWFGKLGDKIELVQAPVQSLAPEYFQERLSDGDVLFIDSTHTVRAGSDCLQIYLRVLPSLTQRLWVHAHDIYLPFPQPRFQFERHVYWTEQYLLYAWLLDNPRTQVCFGSAYNRAVNRFPLRRLMRDRWPMHGASFWWTMNA
jgi:hypothetical protein